MKYLKPSIKVKKIKLNSFLYSGRSKNPFSSFSDFFTVQPAFGITPPDTGSAGLKDRGIKAKLFQPQLP
jgi:hypothetical protein